MNGVMMPSVSAGSSHREARVMCTPQVMVPSGAALAGPEAASVRAVRRPGRRRARRFGTRMVVLSSSQDWALPRTPLIAGDLALATVDPSREPPAAGERLSARDVHLVKRACLHACPRYTRAGAHGAQLVERERS